MTLRVEAAAEAEAAEPQSQQKLIASLNELPAVRQYLERIGAEVRSMTSAAVREKDGRYFRDIATIRLDRATGRIIVNLAWAAQVGSLQELEPTAAEAAAIVEAVKGVTWPRPLTLATLPPLPDNLKALHGSDRLFEFHDPEGRICMLQARMESRDGDKYFEPWTFYSDGQWRRMEPEGLLPLWGLPQLKTYSTVFLHEGAGPAQAVDRLRNNPAMLAAHPWGPQLQWGAHLGWIGGALSPHRTDWSVLPRAGVTNVYIVGDNDPEGHSAIPRISELLKDWGITVRAVRFDDRFPLGFDLADDFPPDLFDAATDGRKAYYGPTFQDCVHPATWATRLGNARDNRSNPPVFLRKEFEREWWMVAGEGTAIFINQHDRSRLYTEDAFNNAIRALSDTARTSDLFKKMAYAQQVKAIAYEPGDKEGVITVEGDRSINTWTAPRVRPAEGDPQPWLDFMAYLIPQLDDRMAVMKWCATLIARPRVRMHYGLLLSSTMQGVGKTTLCEIMRVLIGEKNCRSPSAKDVVESAFNSWIVRKRLVFVNEIYEGGKWGAYQKLKSFITDQTLEANEKMIRSYSIRNWAHFILCSNAEVPLWVEDEDRRFLIPEVTELKRPQEWWTSFYGWLNGGGYGVIAAWAEQFVREHGAVKPGEEAPDSARKRALIEDSRSSEELMVRSIADAAKARGGQVILVESDIVDWLMAKTSRQLKPSTVRGWLRKAGMSVSKDRLKVGGRMTKVASVLAVDGTGGWPALEPYRVKPEELEPM